MPNSETGGTSPENVARMATQKDILKGGETTLIGLFGPRGAMSALIRTPTGAVRRISKGSSLISGRVVAIDETGVRVARGENLHYLAMPGN